MVFAAGIIAAGQGIAWLRASCLATLFWLREFYIDVLRVLLGGTVRRVFWRGETDSQICAKLTSVDQTHWERSADNMADCALRAQNELDAYVEAFGLALLALLAYKIASWFMWRHTVIHPLLQSLQNQALYAAQLTTTPLRRLHARLSPPARIPPNLR